MAKMLPVIMAHTVARPKNSRIISSTAATVSSTARGAKPPKQAITRQSSPPTTAKGITSMASPAIVPVRYRHRRSTGRACIIPTLLAEHR